MSKVVCNWCHREYEEDTARKVSFLGREFILCEEDFQLIWRGLGGVSTICSYFKTAWAARK